MNKGRNFFEKSFFTSVPPCALLLHYLATQKKLLILPPFGTPFALSNFQYTISV